MKKIIMPLAALALTAVVASVAAPANAQSTFASFSGATFKFYNAASGASFTGSTTPVTFTFVKAANGFAAGQSVTATLTAQATKDGAATTVAGTVIQPIKSITYTFTDGSIDLLTLTASSGLTTKGTTTTNVLADDSATTYTYMSDVFSFSNPNTGSTAQTFTKTGNVSGGYKANGGGSFNGAVVPEASTVVSFGALLALGGLAVLRRKSVKTAA